MDTPLIAEIYPLILELEQRGVLTRTFRRLDPQRQQAVIHAILEEAGQSSPAELNIKSVARRAGVSIGSLYQYFGSRQGLMEFSIELVVRLVTAQFKSYRPYFEPLALKEALPIYLQGGFEWAEQDPGFVKFFVSAAYGGQSEFQERVVGPVGRELRQWMEEIFQRAQQRGELQQDVDIEATARLVNVMLIALGDGILLPYLNTYYQIYDEAMPYERVMAAMSRMLESGILRPQPPATEDKG
jgi:AcrR family transcriptional regulator